LTIHQPYTGIETISKTLSGWFYGFAAFSAIQTDSPIYIIPAFRARPSFKTDGKPFRGQTDDPSDEFYVFTGPADGDNKSYFLTQ